MARKKRSPEDIKEYQKQYRARNREKLRVIAKRYRDKNKDVPSHLMRKYGITVDDKISMWNSQNGLCAVCGNALPDVFDRNCHVDHCHETKVVRGLLHWYCNNLVGVAEHNYDPSLVTKVFDYIALHRDVIVRTYGNNKPYEVDRNAQPLLM
jgi:hypothetical protein